MYYFLSGQLSGRQDSNFLFQCVLQDGGGAAWQAHQPSGVFIDLRTSINVVIVHVLYSYPSLSSNSQQKTRIHTTPIKNYGHPSRHTVPSPHSFPFTRPHKSRNNNRVALPRPCLRECRHYRSLHGHHPLYHHLQTLQILQLASYY